MKRCRDCKGEPTLCDRCVIKIIEYHNQKTTKAILKEIDECYFICCNDGCNEEPDHGEIEKLKENISKKFLGESP